jgi:hypothetical protein
MASFTIESDRASAWGLQIIPLLGILIFIYCLSPWLWFNSSLVNNRKGTEILWNNAMRRFKESGNRIMAEAFSEVSRALACEYCV